ncbi:MAG: hypothetical protein U0132_02175 [Gemmatimonadaceae bacterium]
MPSVIGQCVGRINGVCGRDKTKVAHYEACRLLARTLKNQYGVI